MNRLDEVKAYQNLFTKFQKKIPDKYNQIELASQLMNKDIDFLISISNRSDGKTFNYISFFMKLAIELDIKFVLVARHYTLRQAYKQLIYTIADEHPDFDRKHLFEHRTDDYLNMGYGKKGLCIITDLNNATDLKYHSNFLKDYPIIVYDEFLALESDYLSDEWEKLKTIYESIDRNHGNLPYLEIPKIVLLGNAVNFSSPLLANLNIYNKIERHKINTMHQYDNVLLEMRRNNNSNEKRNTRAFDSDNDAMTTGEFDFNTYNLSDDNLRNHISKNGDYFHIKTEDSYLKVMYNVDDYQVNLKMVPYAENYTFCTEVRDVGKEATYLKDTFYKDTHARKYYKPSNLHFDNAYTKSYIVNDIRLIDLNINKVIKQNITYQKKMNQTEFNRHEKMYQDNYIERTKRSLAEKFMYH